MAFELPELDINDFDLKNFNSGHTVKYALYFDKRKLCILPSEEEEKKFPFTNHVCFAMVPAQIQNEADKVNRLIYYIDTNRIIGKLLDDEMMLFLEIARSNKALPHYIKVKSVVKNKKFVLILTKQLPQDMLYIYLTMVRCLQEETAMVRNVNVLCTKYNMPFGLAWSTASTFSFNNSWHNFTGVGRSYGNHNILNNEVNVALAKAIDVYIKKRTEEMKKCAKKGETINGYNKRRFGASEEIMKYIDPEYSINPLLKKVRDVFNKEVYDYCEV